MYFIRLKSTSISIVIFYLLQPEPNWIQSLFLKNKERLKCVLMTDEALDTFFDIYFYMGLLCVM